MATYHIYPTGGAKDTPDNDTHVMLVALEGTTSAGGTQADLTAQNGSLPAGPFAGLVDGDTLIMHFDGETGAGSLTGDGTQRDWQFGDSYPTSAPFTAPSEHVLKLARNGTALPFAGSDAAFDFKEFIIGVLKIPPAVAVSSRCIFIDKAITIKGDLDGSGDPKTEITVYAEGDAAVAGTTFDGTTTVLMGDTSDLAVDDLLSLDSDTQTYKWFEVDSIVANTSVTLRNPDAVTIPTGSGAATRRRLGPSQRGRFAAWKVTPWANIGNVGGGPGQEVSTEFDWYIHSKSATVQDLKMKEYRGFTGNIMAAHPCTLKNIDFDHCGRIPITLFGDDRQVYSDGVNQDPLPTLVDDCGGVVIQYNHNFGMSECTWRNCTMESRGRFPFFHVEWDNQRFNWFHSTSSPFAPIGPSFGSMKKNVIENNTVYQYGQSQSGGRGEIVSIQARYPEVETSDVLVRGNYFEYMADSARERWGISVGTSSNRPTNLSDVSVLNNTIKDAEQALECYTFNAATVLDDVLFYENTISGSKGFSKDLSDCIVYGTGAQERITFMKNDLTGSESVGISAYGAPEGGTHLLDTNTYKCKVHEGVGYPGPTSDSSDWVTDNGTQNKILESNGFSKQAKSMPATKSANASDKQAEKYGDGGASLPNTTDW